jgi:hypothetical protein
MRLEWRRLTALILMIVFGLTILGVAARLPSLVRDAMSGHIGVVVEVVIYYLVVKGFVWSIRRWRRLAQPPSKL